MQLIICKCVREDTIVHRQLNNLIPVEFFLFVSLSVPMSLCTRSLTSHSPTTSLLSQ